MNRSQVSQARTSREPRQARRKAESHGNGFALRRVIPLASASSAVRFFPGPENH